MNSRLFRIISLMALVLLPTSGISDCYDYDEAKKLYQSLLPLGLYDASGLSIGSDTEFEKAVEFVAVLLSDGDEQPKYVGLYGPNPDLGLKALRTALEDYEPQSLRGMTLVFLGKPRHLDELVPLVDKYGFTIRFGEYP